jgi:hypothetical protein
MLRLDNLRLGRSLRWKVEDFQLVRSGSEMWKAGTSKIVAPACSVMDRWVGPRKQVLNIPIACWYMGPVSRCSYVTTWPKPLSPTPRLSWGRKNEVTQDESWASLFLVAKISSGYRGLLRPHGDYEKGCYTLTMWDTYGLGPYADWAWNACGILVGFFPVVCTSIWITVTLGYE